MIKATVTMENDGIQIEVDFEGKGMPPFQELAALNATVINRVREELPSLNIDDVLEVLNGMTKAGLDIFKERSENV